jgi:hypothetical protein
VAEQRGFAFVPLRGEPVSFARMGLDLNWRRVSRRAGALFAERLRQTVTADRARLLAVAFRWRAHFVDEALFAEIRAASRRKARELKRRSHDRRERLSGAVVLACTSEGNHAVRVMDELKERLREWEASALCG